MKKKSESQRIHKSGLRSKNQTLPVNRKTRNSQLESLEERQLLSAVPLAAASEDIQCDVFYVRLSNANQPSDTSTQYVSMHILGDVDAADVKVQDASGALQTILKSQEEDGVTTLLLQMGLGTDYTVMVEGVTSESPINVLFTTPGDTQNFNGSVGSSEYYAAYGMALRDSAGMNQRSFSLWAQKYGVDLNSTQLNPLFDLNGDGKFDTGEFSTLVKASFDQNVSILQTITVRPEITNLKVGGQTAVLVDEDGQDYVANVPGGDLEISGNLPSNSTLKIQGNIQFTDADGNLHTIDVSDMLQNTSDEDFTLSVSPDGSFTLSLKNVKDNSAVQITLSYEGADNSANTYSIQLDTKAPSVVFNSLSLTSSSTTVGSLVYTQDKTPELLGSCTLTQDLYTLALAEVQNAKDGIWAVLTCDGTEVVTIQITKAMLEGPNCVFNESAGTYTLSVALVVPTNLADGTHEFKAFTRDLAGNKTAEKSTSIILDSTKPVITQEGFTANYSGGTQMYVDSNSQTLKVTVKDANLNADFRATMTNSVNNGVELTPTSTDETVAGQVTYTYSLALLYGTNTVAFISTDCAGNSGSASWTYVFNQDPQIIKTDDMSENLTIEGVTQIDGGYEIALEEITTLFKETDGSTIKANNVKFTFDGTAVKGYRIADDGTLFIIFNSLGTSIETRESQIQISYTDDYGKVATFENEGTTYDSIDFGVKFTNDVTAPEASLTNAADFAGKIDADTLVVKGSTATLELNVTDSNEINGASYEIKYETAAGSSTKSGDFVNDVATINLEGLKDGSRITIKYFAEDEFGNRVGDDGKEIAVILVDATVNGTISTFTPQAASPAKVQPKLNLKVDWTDNEKMNAVITYAGTLTDGTNVSGTFREKFVVSDGGSTSNFEFNGIAGPELADGTYAFTVTVSDNAGNEKTAVINNYVLDTTVPTVSITNTSDYTNESPITLNFSYSDVLSGVASMTLTHNGTAVELGGADKNEPTESKEINLVYGTNTFVVTVTDAAGNISASDTYEIVWNVKPTAIQTNAGFNGDESTPATGTTLEKAVFDQLMSIGFRETSGENEGKIVLDLADYVTDEATLLQDGSISLTGANPAIASAEIVNGELILTMNSVTLNQTLTSDLAVTLKDAYDEKIDVLFHISYIFDDQAPTVKPANLTLANNVAYETGKLVLDGSNDLSISATITDDTAIKSWGWALKNASGTVIASNSGTIDDENVKSQSVMISKVKTDLANGTYTLSFWGDDGITNVSEADNPSTSYEILVDSVAPVFNGTVTLKTPATPTNATAQTISVTTTTLTEANDSWLVIYDNGTKVAEAKAENGAFPTEIAVSDLADGTHAFTYQVFDVASRAAFSSAQTIGSVVVDTVAPVINSITLNGTSPIIEATGATTMNVAKFNFDITDSQTVTKSYSTDGGSTWSVYDADDGVTLGYGTTTFHFKAIDAAGNETVWTSSIDVSYDHSPILSANTLGNKEFALNGTNTVKVTYSEAEIKALFKDDDLLSGDTLSFMFNFTAADGLAENISLTSQQLVGTDYELTFTIDQAAVKAVHEVGTLTVTAEDSFDQAITTSAATISKTNLAPEQVSSTQLVQTQKTTGTIEYAFDISGYFSDPESDAWTVKSASVSTDGSVNGTCVINGKTITWTPASGAYGNAVLSLTVKDAQDKETTGTVNVLINWAGITALTASDKTIAEDTTGAQTITVTAENAFDSAKAWGDYEKTTDWTVAIKDGTQTVSGAVVTTDGDGTRTQTFCTSLFTAAPTVANGTVSFTLAENAYGSVTLTVSAKGATQTTAVTKDLKVTVTNDVATPYAPALSADYQVSASSVKYLYADFLAKCDTDEDSGELTVDITGSADSENYKITPIPGSEDTRLSLVKGERTYVFRVAFLTDGIQFTRDGIFDGEGTTELTDIQESDWEVLDGVSLDFSYEVKNDRTEATATNTFTLNFSAIAKTVTETATRSKNEQTIKVSAASLIGETGWALDPDSLTCAEGSVLSASYNAGTGNIEIVVPAYDFTNESISYTLEKDGETKTYSAKINIVITDVNWAPTWATDVTLTDETYAVSQAEKDTAYEIDLSGLFADHDTTNDDLTIVVKSGTVSVTDARTGYSTSGTVKVENGKLVFTPADKNFNGTVNVTLSVTDEEVGDDTLKAAAQTADFNFKLNVTNVNDVPVLKEGADLTIEAKTGGTSLNLTTLLADKFVDPDGDTIVSVTCNGSESFDVPTTIGITTFQIVATDSAGTQSEAKTVKLVVSGSAQIEDMSLEVTTSQSNDYAAGTKLGNSVILSADFTASGKNTTCVPGSVLKSGTILKSGTMLPYGTEISCSSKPDWIDEAYWDEETKSIGIYNDEGAAVNLTTDVTLDSDLTVNSGTIMAKSGSTLVAGSTLAKGSTPGAAFTNEDIVQDDTRAIKIFNACCEEVDGKIVRHSVYLKQELNLTMNADSLAKLQPTAVTILVYDDVATDNRVSKEIQVVGEIPASELSPFKYIAVEDGKFYAYYSPYDVIQDRASQDVTITLNDGTALTVTLSTNWVKPFEVVYGIVEDANDSTREVSDTVTASFVSSVETGKIYTFQMWVKCNLPLLSKELRDAVGVFNYGALAFMQEVEFTLPNVIEVGDGDISDKCDPHDNNSTSLKLKWYSIELTSSAAGGISYDASLYGLAYAQFTTATAFDVSDVSVASSKMTCGLIVDIDKESGIGMNSDVEIGDGGVSGSSAVNKTQITEVLSYPTPVKGTSSTAETVVEGNGVYLALVTEKSESETSETLRASDAYVTEWDSSWVELWVNTQEDGVDIADVRFDLAYDTNVFTATAIEYSSFVSSGLKAEIDDAAGTVKGLGGNLSHAVTNADGFVLLGRVKLESVGTDGVAADTVNSVSTGLAVGNVILRNSEQSVLDVNSKVYVNTKVFAVVYDVNDDNEININDLVRFAKKFGVDSTVTTDASVWALDFNNSGSVDVMDLVSFAKNFGKERGGNTSVTYPNKFFQTWIGSTLETNGDSNVADTLDSAIASWSESLGEELNIDVQIIVKDYENVEGGILGETIILGCDEDGKPNTAVVYLDEDALGMGWYVGKSDDVIGDQYDLYSVLLHELGHALGMSDSYDGYNEVIGSGLTYTNGDGSAYLVFNGHVYSEGDLMNETINTGTRLAISDVDAEIVASAREVGTSVRGGVVDAATGADAAAVQTVVASGIMEETAWNQMLIQSATLAVQKANLQLNEKAWNAFDENVDDSKARSEMAFAGTKDGAGVNLATAGTESVWDGLFNDDEDDFTDVLDEIAEESLKVKLNSNGNEND